MIKIKFSHQYTKMPQNLKRTRLLQIFICDRKELGELFVNYDTAYNQGFYELPKGKVIVLLLQSLSSSIDNGMFFGDLWTTIRRWTPRKEEYYRGVIGQDVEIIINE